MTTQNFDRVIALLNGIGIDIDFRYHLQGEEFTTASEVQDILDNAGAFDIEIIYYSQAMEYLMQNDNSLRESLSIASEMGYSPENLSSEILASLLASQNARNDFSEIYSELDSLLAEIQEEETAAEETE